MRTRRPGGNGATWWRVTARRLAPLDLPVGGGARGAAGGAGRAGVVDIEVNLGRLKLRNPFLAASGTFGYGSEYAPIVDLSRLGGVVTKSLSVKPREGNPPPRL